MRLIDDIWYEADEGKHFVLTEKGKAEVASYRHGIVGEPANDYDYMATKSFIDNGYEIEVDIPDWIETKGYQVVYDYNGTELCLSNTIFPLKELAEKYMKNYKELHKRFNETPYIKETVYKGRKLKDCRIYDGRKVYNQSWIFGIDTLNVGDLVEQEIVDDIVDCMPPACMRNDCTQCGEPSYFAKDENGRCRDTYSTFKKIADRTWEYCGDCFKGCNVHPK